MQLEAVWNLLLQAGPEGPTLISCAASWRTFTKSLLKDIFMNRRLRLESKDNVQVEWT
jgi:hypothetical protein